ncbi:hypothetical protein NQ317_008882, partial [Molorchus minor]
EEIVMLKPERKKSKSVTTLLEAKWESTPLVLEVAEYLVDENVDLYWSFIDSINSIEPPLVTIENDKARYDKIMDHASKLLTPSQLSVLKLGLSLHVYSPKVQMYKQIAQERNLPECATAAVVDIAGNLTCKLKDIKKIDKGGNDENRLVDLFRADHYYPGSANRTVPVVLYGELGTKSFLEYHKVLKQLAVEGDITYIIRHYVKNKSNKRLRLSGYGVELQMKSTEYKSQDDTQLHDDPSSEESSQEDEDTEIEGFEFAKLKKIFPELKKDLDKFKAHLEETSNELAPLKVWQFQDLSAEAAERIMNAPKDEALKVLINIAQNFPMQAKGLVKTVVKPELKAEMKKKL